MQKEKIIRKNKDLRKISLKNDYNPLDLFDGLPYNKSKGNVAENTFSFNLNQDDTSSGLSEKGTEIKNRVQSAVSNLFPGSNNKELFKDIDGATIEKNIPLAESVIEKNRASNSVNRNLFKNLTYLKDGLAMFYAAFEQGNYKAADMARKLAYTEATEQPLPDVAKTAKTQTSNKRYVNADIGLNVCESPGTDSRKIGSLGYNQEVEFTGKKVGETLDNMWAEIKYGDKTGWVAAKYLNLEKPYAPNSSNATESPKNENKGNEPNKSTAGTRYIGEKEISMRDAPGFVGKPIGDAYYGESVIYTGNKKKVDGLDWAEVKYGNKTRWILANCLKTAIPDSVIDKNVPKGMIVNQSMGTEDRTKHLNEMIPKWMTEKGDNPTKYDMIEWYKNNGANVRYTGTYCLPIKMNMARISQGFYGTTSHAGKHGYKDSGNYGAVDIAAARYSPVYSVLEGKVVYTPSPGFDDFHRVTVETKINGETYYLEYLHLEDVNVKTGQILKMGDNVGTVGGWLRNGPSNKNIHLDFRIYKFTNENNKNFSSDGAKQFFDPFEFFDFDIQYKPKQGMIDYN